MMTDNHLYRYAFTTAFGVVSVVFQKGALPIKRIWLPTTDRIIPEEGNGNTVRLISRPPYTVSKLCKAIQAYFSGKPIEPTWEILDLRPFTHLQQKVLKTVATVKHGHTQTYGQIADRVGHPGASRFVGTTLRKNPFPVVIPCHRIIRSDGSAGAFAGGMKGTELKKRMLTLELSSLKGDD